MVLELEPSLRPVSAEASCEIKQADRACERMFLSHRRRLLQYARLKGCGEHDAEDVVQELFLRLIRLGVLLRLSGEPDETQAAHLTRTLRCMILNQWRNRIRLRRGGAAATLSLEDLAEEGVEVPCAQTPTTDLDRAWGLGILERGFALLRARMDPSRWHGIESSLLDDPPSAGLRGASVAHRVAAHRARVELRHILSREIGFGADTRRASAELFHALGRCA